MPSARDVDPPDHPQGSESIRWLAPLVVALLTVAAFLPALQNQFLNWEDDVNLVNNPAFRGLGWSNLQWMLTTTHTGHWIPLTWLSFGVDHQVWGMDPFGYHLTNVLLHLAGALAFYFVALRLLRAAMPGAGEIPLRLGAAAAALFFAVNPLRVESVAWATERRDVLSGLWFQLSILMYLKAAAAERGRTRRLWASVACFALAILSKSIVMTLPLVLIVLDAYPLRRLPARIRQWWGRGAWPIWAEKVPYLLLALLAAIVAGYAQRGAVETLAMRSLASRVAVACYGLVFYLGKSLFPFAVSPLYEIPYEVDPLAPAMLGSTLTVATVTILLILFRRKWPAGLAVWLCYGFLLAPVSGILQAGPQLVAARYSYLPCLGWAVLFGGGIVVLAWRAASTAPLRHWARLGTVAAGGWLLILSVLTWNQTGVWRDSESLWTYVTRHDPTSSIAHSNLSVPLIEQGRYGEAEEHLQAALRINPEYENALANLAALLARTDKFVEAGEVRARLGYLFLKHGKVEQAVQLFHEEVELRPGDPAMHNNLGAALYARGEIGPAIAEFEEALRLNPGDEKARRNLDAARAARSP